MEPFLVLVMKSRLEIYYLKNKLARKVILNTLKTKRVITSNLVLIFLLTGCASGVSTGESGYVAGTRGVTWVEKSKRIAAPEISGKTLTGEQYENRKNTVTVLNVWASWCSPCRAEAPLLQDFSTRYSNVNFIGVLTRDNLSAAKSFVDNFKITYPSLIDDEILLGFKKSLSPNAIPTTLIIDQQNKVAVRFSGAVTVANLEEYLNKVLSET